MGRMGHATTPHAAWPAADVPSPPPPPGRIGSAYARMMVEGHKMHLVYYDPYPNAKLEAYIKAYGDLLEAHGEPRVTCTRLETVEEVLQQADVSAGRP